MKSNTLTSINKKSLNLFNAVLEQKEKESSPMLIKEYGVFLNSSSSYAYEDVNAFLKNKKLTGEELNTTFHKSWNKVLTTSRTELLIHQIVHYLTGYGTNFTGNLYIPSEKVELEGKDLPVYVIGVLTQEEMVEKAKTMLASGIALKSETINDILGILDSFDYKFVNVDWIKNKEAKIKVMEKTNIFPKDPTEFLRYVVYKTVGETLLIKNDHLINKIKVYKEDSKTESTLAYELFEQYGLENLASIFNRFKPIFLAYKTNGMDKEKRAINKISKLSKTLHKPMVHNPINMVTHKLLGKEDEHWLENATPYALFRALNACVLRMNDQNSFVYKIRNGKSWVSEGNVIKNKDIIEANYIILLDFVNKKFANKFEGKTVYIPEHVRYGLPTSEKMFIGNIPMGTSIISNNIVAGVYWQNDFGATDLDLSGIDSSGNKYGWDSYYRNELRTLAYSGDMTHADTGAVEYLYMNGVDKNKKLPDTLVQVNCYSGNMGNHDYNIIVGITDEPTQEYMLNPKNLVLNERFKSNSEGSFTGVIHYINDQMAFTLYPLSGSQTRVSVNNKISETARQAFIHEATCGMSLNHLFSILDIKFTESREEADFDLDLENMNKSVFIEMFS